MRWRSRPGSVIVVGGCGKVGAIVDEQGVGDIGTAVALRRYPVKSMLGEDLREAELDAAGVAGDRAMALIDRGTGRVATAKHPRLWRALLKCTATRTGAGVRITVPDGRTVDADDQDVDRALSAFLGREVRLASGGDLPRSPQAVRRVLADNRVDVPGFGVLPCAGVYAEVLVGGTVRLGDPVALR
jgi:hypothetical protein